MPSYSPAERVGLTVLGKYRLEKLLGQGGMGAVYSAENIRLGRPIAIKFLLPHLASSQLVVARFLNEARIASALRHPNVVDVFDIDTAEDGAPFIVMERLEGESLRELLARKRRLSLAETVEVLAPVMRAIAWAHQHGVVHRDLKPDNVFLHLQGSTVVPKVLDFGIAKASEGLALGLTSTGAVLGTAMYMAPEQARAESVGPWTDVWALGMIWYESLTGQLAYDFDPSASPTAAIVKIITQPPLPIRSRAPDLDRGIADLIDRAVEHDFRLRFASAADLLEALGGLGAAQVPARAPIGDLSRAPTLPGPAVPHPTVAHPTVPHATVPHPTPRTPLTLRLEPERASAAPARTTINRVRATLAIVVALLGFVAATAVALVLSVALGRGERGPLHAQKPEPIAPPVLEAESMMPIAHGQRDAGMESCCDPSQAPSSAEAAPVPVEGSPRRPNAETVARGAARRPSAERTAGRQSDRSGPPDLRDGAEPGRRSRERVASPELDALLERATPPGDLVIPALPDEPSPAQIASAMQALAPRLAACVVSFRGTLPVDYSVMHDGRIMSVSFPRIGDPREQRCFRDVLNRAVIPRFSSQQLFRFTYRFEIR